MQLSGEELHSIGERDSGGAGSGGSDSASPLTARSLRLERVVQALAHSQEELRRYIFRLTICSILINSASILFSLCIFCSIYIQALNMLFPMLWQSHLSK